MKIRIFFIWFSAFLLLLIVGVYLYAPTYIASIVKHELGKVFTESSVSIGKCQFNPKSELRIIDVGIKREGVYDFIAKKVSISYNIPQLLKGKIDSVSLNGIFINVDSRDLAVSEFGKMINVPVSEKPSIFTIKKIDLSDVNLKVSSKDIDVEGRFSLKFFPEDMSVSDIEFFISTVEGYNVSLKEFGINGSLLKNSTAILKIKSITYNKIVIENILGAVKSEDGAISLDLLSAKLFSGVINGNILADFTRNKKFFVNMNCSEINLATFVRDFNLDERIELSGKLKGNVSLNGEGLNFKAVDGAFETGSEGGVLIIKDSSLVDSLATRTNQPIDIVSESLKNYTYNTGIVKMSLHDNDVILSIEMEGERGSRVFDIVFHDIDLITQIFEHK